MAKKKLTIAIVDFSQKNYCNKKTASLHILVHKRLPFVPAMVSLYFSFSNFVVTLSLLGLRGCSVGVGVGVGLVDPSFCGVFIKKSEVTGKEKGLSSSVKKEFD